MIKKYTEHAAASLMPEMTPNDFETLKEDIKANGLLDPIELYDGKIIDGRHRYSICQQLKIEPTFEDKTEFIEKEWAGSLVDYVWSKHKRRNLTQGQIAMIAAMAEELNEKERKEAAKRRLEGQRAGGPLGGRPPRNLPDRDDQEGFRPKLKKRDKLSTDEVGKKFGVGGSSVRRAQSVQKRSPELAKDVKEGRISLDEAAKVGRKPRNGKPKQEPANGKKKVWTVTEQPTERIETVRTALNKYAGSGPVDCEKFLAETGSANNASCRRHLLDGLSASNGFVITLLDSKRLEVCSGVVVKASKTSKEELSVLQEIKSLVSKVAKELRSHQSFASDVQYMWQTIEKIEALVFSIPAK